MVVSSFSRTVLSRKAEYSRIANQDAGHVCTSAEDRILVRKSGAVMVAGLVGTDKYSSCSGTRAKSFVFTTLWAG